MLHPKVDPAAEAKRDLNQAIITSTAGKKKGSGNEEIAKLMDASRSEVPF